MQGAALAQVPDGVVQDHHDDHLDRDWLAVAASAVGLVFSVGTLAIYTFGVFVGRLSRGFGWSRTELFGAPERRVKGSAQQSRTGQGLPITGAHPKPSRCFVSLIHAGAALLVGTARRGDGWPLPLNGPAGCGHHTIASTTASAYTARHVA